MAKSRKTPDSPPTPHPNNCDCPICGDDKDFTIPDELLTKIENGDVVLFAGAGISTENKRHCAATFYEEILFDLKISGSISFPALMTKFCSQPDGRIKLIEKIKRRFDYFRSFQDFYWYMTRFHRSISPLYMIKDIVTTNWDDFFETECMSDAIVYDGDVPFLDASPRRIIKIHGSIANFGSIVATEQDYKKSYKRLNDGPLGSHLKSLIARKTVIYVGYSLSDENYLRMLRNISRMTTPHIRQSYIIAPNIDIAKLKCAPIPLTPIETNGAYFFEKVREQLDAKGRVVSDTAFEDCRELLDHAIEIHNDTADAFASTRHPLLILALSYQDGLIHALKRILKRRKSGDYHAPARLDLLIQSYDFKFTQYRKKKDFWNAAYTEGYKNGMMFLLMSYAHKGFDWPPDISLPFNLNIYTLPMLLRFPRKNIPKPAVKQLKRIDSRLSISGEGTIPDHTPYV